MTRMIENQEFTRIAYFDNRGLYFETWYPTKHLVFLSGRATYWRVE